MEPIKMTEEEKLEKAKELYKTANADQRYVLECLFSELAESEDERIRKALIEACKQSLIVGGFHKDKVIAWLEKQGSQILANPAKTCKDGQKPAETEKGAKGNDREIPNSAWSEEDENMLNLTLGLLPYHRQCRNWLKSLKDKVQPQPKQEWSEEDEIARKALINLVEIYYGSCIDKTEKNRLLNLLKSLRP